MDKVFYYKRLLELMPEKTIQSIVDSLASGEYDRKEIESLVSLSEAIKETVFTFGDKQLDKQANALASSIEHLNDFLSTHYAPHDSQAVIFQLYPKEKYADSIKTADGGFDSWVSLKQKGLEFGRKVKEDYVELVELYLRKERPDDRPRFKHKLPAGTRWENFIFTIPSDENKLRVQVGQLNELVTYEDMGFLDARTGRPTIQWELLKLFAKNSGEIPANSSDARDSYKKQKQLLSQKLQQYFSIDFDPFEPYERAYKTKFVIFIEGE